MSERYGPFHRLGEPGGSGCAVTVLDIAIKRPDGLMAAADLLDAGTAATEVELLRTIAHSFGVRWGHDDLGWWAVVPRDPSP
jgi:hypothetical protein